MARRRANMFGISLTVLMLLTGCAETGALDSPPKIFRGTEVLDLPVKRADILDVIADVGKSLGYSVSQLDRAAGIIGLSSDSSLLTRLLTGTMNTLTLQTKEDGRRLAVNVMVSGFFGTGDQDAATRLVTDFKRKLIERLRQP